MLSLNRLLAALIMGGVMTAVILGFMWKMYKSQSVKIECLREGCLSPASCCHSTEAKR